MAEQEPGQKERESDLLGRIARLEQELSRLTRLSGRPITVQQLHVNELRVDALYLDQLSYRLDSLAVRELSGSLNLGNNIGSIPGLYRPEASGDKSAPPAREDTETTGAEGEEGVRTDAESGVETRGDAAEGTVYPEARKPPADSSGRSAERTAPTVRRTGSGVRFTFE